MDVGSAPAPEMLVRDRIFHTVSGGDSLVGARKPMFPATDQLVRTCKSSFACDQQMDAPPDSRRCAASSHSLAEWPSVASALWMETFL